MTPEQRLDRAERILKLMIKAGGRARREWREKVNILIDVQIRDAEEWRARSRAHDEKINILIDSQMETSEAVKGLATGQAELAKSQKLTDQALRGFIDSLRKGGNGNSSN
jgi:hypothetical protein